MPDPFAFKNFLREGTIQVVSGGSAGFIEICLMHPLDVVKTRFQIQNNPNDPERYKSIADCFRRMIRSEGFVSLYKGIQPPIIAETPKRALKFFTFEQYKVIFRHNNHDTPFSLSLAGLLAGLTEAVFVNPFEVVKVRQQTNKSKVKQLPPSSQVFRQIYSEGGFGLNGLMQGLSSTMIRNGIFNMVYFGFYHSVKVYVPTDDKGAIPFEYKLLTGFTAGSLASCFNIPFDVAKSRIQSTGHLPDSKYKGCLQSVGLVYREEGFRALYKGLVPKVLRLGPGGAVMMVVFEHLSETLKEKWPRYE